MNTKVYLFDTIDKAEESFKEFIRRTDCGGKHKYRWSGTMGSFDLDNDRIYCMTMDQFKTWEKTHSNFTTARGNGVVEGLLKRI